MTKALNDLGATKEEMQKWIDTLRSGKYQQGQGRLQTLEGFCCLGVACDVFIPKDDVQRTASGRMDGLIAAYQQLAPKWLKDVNQHFTRRAGYELVVLNDRLNFTFDDIADLLQAVYIEGVLDGVN